MLLIQGTQHPSGKPIYINFNAIAEIEPTNFGCTIMYITPDETGDQVYRCLASTIEQILSQIPEVQNVL